jgi:hypothetical protein
LSKGQAMIELIHDLPDNVVGIITYGRVTRDDCDDVLLPAMEEALRRHERVRLYYEIGSRYPGAGWDAVDIGTHNLERIAIVCDSAWVGRVFNALRFLITSEVRVFTKEEEEEGRAWIAAPNEDVFESRAILSSRSLLPLQAHGMAPRRRRKRQGLARLAPTKSVRASLEY